MEAESKSQGFDPFLEQVINHGTNLCNEVVERFPPNNITMVSISLYREILATLDAIHVLLLQKEADFRSRCYLYHYFKENRKQCEFSLSGADQKAAPAKAKIIKGGAGQRISEIDKQLQSGIFDDVIKPLRNSRSI